MPYQFQGQRSSETVVLVTRQHPFVLLRPLLVAAALFLIPLVAYVFIDLGTLFSWIFIIALLAGTLVTISRLVAWWNSIVVLTDQRVIVLNQHGLLHREMTECSLLSIQQVSHTMHGLLHTVLKFGDIHIFTAGSHEPFIIHNAPQAFEMQQEIMQYAEGSPD